MLDVQAAGAGFVVLTDGGVFAVDGTTGTERWHYRRDDLSIADTGGLRILDDGRTVVLPLGGWGRLHAFTGELLWQTNERYEQLSTEVADARTALVSVEDRVDGEPTAVARSSRTGAVMWRQPLGCSLGYGPARYHRTPSDVVIVRCENEEDVPLVVAFDAKDGRELWRHELGTGEQAQSASPVGPDVVAVADDTGRDPMVRLFDQRSGQLLSSFPGRAIDSDGLAFDGTSFVEPGHGVRWTYDGARGKLAAERDVRTEAVLPTAIAALAYRPGGTHHDRLLLIFDRETGVLRQEFSVSTYQTSQVGPQDGPWVVAGPGAVVTVTDLGSTSYGAELVGYR